MPPDADNDDAAGVSVEELAAPPAVLDWAFFLHSLQIAETAAAQGTGQFYFTDLLADMPSKRDLGFVHDMDFDKNGTNIRATCRRHKRCVCWVQVPMNFGAVPPTAVLHDLVEWIGAGRFTDAAAHKDLGDAAKRKYGMKPRMG